MSVFEDIKNGLLQAITFEKERKAIRSHFERSKKDIKDGRVLLTEEGNGSVKMKRFLPRGASVLYPV